MRKYVLLLLLTACTNEHKSIPVNQEVKIKNCIDLCVSHSFGNFHNEGNSWGTGSSSMNGLSQEKIFDRVLKYCSDFYNNEKCCKGDSLENWHNIETIHGYNYGVCK